MNPKEFLEYLVSIGLATRQVIPVRKDHPEFPYQNSVYADKNSTFSSKKIRYTIEIPIAVNDKINVVPKISLPSEKVTRDPSILERILIFLEKLAHSDHVHSQAYGITFMGGYGGWDSKYYKADHRDNMDVSVLSALSAIAMPARLTYDPLNFATALNYLKDTILLLKEQKNNNAKSVEKTKNNTINNNTSDDIPPDTTKKEKVTIKIVNKPKIEEKYDIATDSVQWAFGDREGGYIYKKGDTIAKFTIECWGGNSITRTQYYPSRDTIK